ncbi:unnamed protein product [Phytophthora lilii]|uniref:Unnamed protein product n=1 Tax=Phytophthora lilii TaxID=2077276 RepID=A0A9W6X140_9STRA|nr:unnamed protein product [Phytophthora lilii]
MKALRQDVHDLEEEYARTIQLKQQQQQWREVAEALSGDEDREPSSDLVEQYMQLSIKKEQLQRENQELALIAAQHATFQLKAQHLLEAEDLPMASPSWLMGVRALCFWRPGWSSWRVWDRRGCGARYLPSCCCCACQLSALGFDPMTVAECHRIGIEAYQQIRAFLESNSYLTTACELFGWSERRREAPDHVKFTLKKHFTGTTPMDMSARAWRVVSSPRGLAGLYSSTMHLSLKVLQVVDDHNVVMYRVIRGARSTRAVQSLFLVSRFHVESGYIILFRSVDRSRLQKLGGDEEAEDKWLDMFTWSVGNALWEALAKKVYAAGY